MLVKKTMQPQSQPLDVDLDQTVLLVSAVVEAAELLRRTYRFPVLYAAGSSTGPTALDRPLIRILRDMRSRTRSTQFTIDRLRDTLGSYAAEHAEAMQTALMGASVLQLALPTRRLKLQPREVNTFRGIETTVDAGLRALGLPPSDYFVDFTHVLPDEDMRAAMFFFALQRFITKVEALRAFMVPPVRFVAGFGPDDDIIADSFDLNSASSGEDLRDDLSDADTVDLNREMSVEV